jgi:Protein of unknown function (DUF1822)
MKNRRTLIIEGSSDQLEQIIALFEAGRLQHHPLIEVLDVGINSINQAEITPVDLYRVWLDSLWHKGFQPTVRSLQATATNKKIIRFQSTEIEIVMTIVPIANVEIQIFLQIRPLAGKGYLPTGLKVSILDEMSEVILEKSALDRSNLLDLTEDGDLICQLADCFKLELTLNGETVAESFPS